jgi:predicted choloylglycine hydrolase
VARNLTFEAVDYGRPGSAVWAARASELWPATLRTWAGGELPPPEVRPEALAQFAEHMPELVPVLGGLAAAIDEPAAAAVLTQVTFKPFFVSCSQSGVAAGLVRNYDFDPKMCERTIGRTDYLRPVIGMNEGLWGMLDGMNGAGLAVSLTFGGRFVYGPGMCIAMVVRYLLETCDTVDEAWQRLQTIPVSTAQNLTLADRARTLSVHVGPDIAPTRAADACVTNHQLEPVSDEQEKESRTLERLAAARAATACARNVADPVESLAEAMLRSPLYNFDLASGLGTLYTAAYRPSEGRVSYRWPDTPPWEQSFAAFQPGTKTVTLSEPAIVA